jgi:hypothetical protein
MRELLDNYHMDLVLECMWPGLEGVVKAGMHLVLFLAFLGLECELEKHVHVGGL